MYRRAALPPDPLAEIYWLRCTSVASAPPLYPRLTHRSRGIEGARATENPRKGERRAAQHYENPSKKLV